MQEHRLRPVWCLVLCGLLALSAAPSTVRGGDSIRDLEQQAREGKPAAFDALAKQGEAGVKALGRLMLDSKLPDHVRWMSANALGKSQEKSAAKPLLEALKEQSMNVRRCAAGALGRLGITSAKGALERLRDEDPYVWLDPETSERRHLVREAANDALRMLFWEPMEVRTGTPFSDTIDWAPDVQSALKRAKKEKKLVLATVVPLSDACWTAGDVGSLELRARLGRPPFSEEMAHDSEPGLVKERALMGAVFTDPEVVHLVKAHFVAVRVRLHTYFFDRRGIDVALRDYGVDPLRRLGTAALETSAPALVVATARGKHVHTCRRLGVFSAPMARGLLRAALGKAGVKKIAPWEPERSQALEAAWAHARTGRWTEAWSHLEKLPAEAEGADAWEAAYLRGLVAWRVGREEEARAQWRRTREGDGPGPWGSKAAMHLARRGVRLEEWESLGVPDGPALAEQTERGEEAPPLDRVRELAVAYLLGQQRPDGAWQDPRVSPHGSPGPRSPTDMSVARTALVVSALLSSTEEPAEPDERIAQAIAKGVEYVGRFADDPPEHVWQLTYALHLQVQLLQRGLRGDEREAVERRVRKLLTALQAIQQQGGWSYMPPPRTHSFNTAPVLLMLAQLKKQGIRVPERVAADAADFLKSLRAPGDPRDFKYAANIHHDDVKASSCRTALCELALIAHEDAEEPTKEAVGRVRAAVELFFEFEPLVRDTTKVFESYFSLTALHDAYHYYFGHYYTARALALLPRKEAAKFAAKQIGILLRQAEFDGSFVDAQMQGKSYSTAMALLALAEDLKYAQR